MPVEFNRSAELLKSCINSWQPDLVLCVGQAGGRPQISLEQVAINLLEARIPDNSGWQPSGEPIVATGPAAYFSTLPLKAIRQQLQQQGIPANISYTAGTYVCNALMYQLLHQLSSMVGRRGGFIHIPYTPEQAAGKPDAASLSVTVVVQALLEIVRCCQQYSEDITAAGGTLD
ncbi:MAG: pyroglutamyl-peptidase I [Rheinheimera sp.]|nr:pyroglutamyl-peptidase I [Rheinheimera sp.]